MIRYYPYPNMVYKIVLNKWISEDGKSVSDETKGILKSAKIEKKPEQEPSSLEVSKKVSAQNEVVETQKVEQQSEINDALFSKIWDQIDSKTLQHGLKNYVHIKSVTDWKIELIVIDKVTEISMKKEENQKLLEQKILENTGKAYSLDIAYMDKDEYFSQMML